jgi:hypothetical protein
MDNKQITRTADTWDGAWGALGTADGDEVATLASVVEDGDGVGV